ncbi:MAG: AIR synthase-related protein, partial [Pseudomonadota bacterium]|nr:AIR synthase-related protein [Pseudomonadota bacterium]
YAAHQGITEIYAPPPIDLDAEEQTGKLLAKMIASRTVTAAHDISDGGLAVTIAEMCLHSSFGAHITPPTGGHLHGWAFGEDQARYVVTTDDGAALSEAAQNAGVAISKIGIVTAKTELQFGDDDTISVEALKNLSEGCLPALMAG